jgi:hypothetical protein
LELAPLTATLSTKILAGEACRLADRLDKLDLLLAGDIETWVTLTHNLMTADYELKINSAETAARQTALALRQIIGQLTASGEAVAPGGSLADELEARRTARQANASG